VSGRNCERGEEEGASCCFVVNLADARVLYAEDLSFIPVTITDTS